MECIDAAIAVLKYVKAASYNVGVIYESQKELLLKGFSDTDHTSDFHRLSRYSFNTFLNNHHISWTSKKLNDLTLSSCESELYGGNFSGNELLFLEKLQADFLICRALNEDDEVLTPSL